MRGAPLRAPLDLLARDHHQVGNSSTTTTYRAASRGQIPRSRTPAAGFVIEPVCPVRLKSSP